MKKVADNDDLLSYRWVVASCGDENCWCRCIALEEPAEYENGSEAHICGSGSLTKEAAEHIVKIHNESLEVNLRQQSD